MKVVEINDHDLLKCIYSSQYLPGGIEIKRQYSE